MEEIIKTLLLEGIDEATIHRVLDVIEEEYEVVESLSNQIDKKFKKGEINLDKAFELENKIEKNMSADKKEQEHKEELQKDSETNPHSLAHVIRRRAIGKSIRRHEKKTK